MKNVKESNHLIKSKDKESMGHVKWTIHLNKDQDKRNSHHLIQYQDNQEIHIY